MTVRFALLIPMKPWHRAKSRLEATAGIAPEFARAFALDAIAAAGACALVDEIHVITDQVDFALPGIHVVPDEGGGDLNAALRAAESRVRRDREQLAIAAMCADLPCLLPADLEAALGRVGTDSERLFVTDAAGTGTTLLATGGGALDPHFGVDSARLHRESGAVDVGIAVPTLRRDVDTATDLEEARALGLGAHTHALLT